MSDFEEYQRRRFMRPDAHRYIRHDAYRFMKPGSPVYVGEDVVKYFWPQEEREQTAEQTSDALDAKSAAELLEYRRELAKLRLEWELLKLAIKARKYNPDQPRAPAGSPGGGQWTSDGGLGGEEGPGAQDSSQENEKESEDADDHKIVHDRSGEEPWKSVASQYRADGSLARQTILNRDGSFVVSEFSADPHADGWDERHRVQLADGSVTTFQNSGDRQVVFDEHGKRLSEADVIHPEAPQPAFYQTPAVAAGRLAVQKSIEAGLTLYTWLSSKNSSEGAAVLEYPAREIKIDEGTELPVVSVRQLSSEELKLACKKYDHVVDLVSKAANETRAQQKNWTPQAFGTEVHTQVAREINGRLDEPPGFRSPDDPQNRDYRAEFSILKARAEDPTYYGQKGTIRIDVLEKVNDQLACVYDIKTGKQPLTLARSFEIASNVRNRFPTVNRIIVVEARPGR